MKAPPLVPVPSLTDSPLSVGPCFSTHPVGFSLLTAEPYQYAAYYDGDRIMTVAQRRLDSTRWSYARLPEEVLWDSHNYVTMGLDATGHVHVSGNMHNVPLIYFRMTEPHKIGSFERVRRLVGDRESNATYPDFFHDPKGNLIFGYRDGSSGNGDQIYDRYDAGARTWSRLTAAPITSGEGACNAYLHGPRRGPDGFFHLVWVWRDSPDASTNHDICYARSRDLVSWETSWGQPLWLPILRSTAEIIDPVPAGGGLINGNVVIGFDSKGRVIVSYHKLDEQGQTQLFHARLERNGWYFYRTSLWTGSWHPSGWGTLNFQIRLLPVRVGMDGRLSQGYRHFNEGKRIRILNEETLQPVETITEADASSVGTRLPTTPGMRRMWCASSGTFAPGAAPFALTWETHEERNDDVGTSFAPPSLLQVVRLGPEGLNGIQFIP